MSEFINNKKKIKETFHAFRFFIKIYVRKVLIKTLIKLIFPFSCLNTLFEEILLKVFCLPFVFEQFKTLKQLTVAVF